MGGAEIKGAQVGRKLPDARQGYPGVAAVVLTRRSGRSVETDSSRGEGERGQRRGRGREGAGAVQVSEFGGVGADRLLGRIPHRGGNLAGSGPNTKRGR